MPKVRFSEADEDEKRASNKKRKPNLQNNGDGILVDNGGGGFRPRKQRPRPERPNEDEIDDIDEWVECDNDNDDEPLEGVPNEKELLEMKRKRRERRETHYDAGSDADENDEEEFESTDINANTSLATEGIEIEPFNMEKEKSDGTGYFDGDTYVFRKRDEEEEPDAWLESLSDTKEVANANASAIRNGNDHAASTDENNNNMDNWSKEDLYSTIAKLIGDKETTMQALTRYGNLIKRKPLNGKKGHKDAVSNDQKITAQSADSEAQKVAKTALDELTAASSALLLKGDVDIYQKSGNDLRKLIRSQQSKEAANGTAASAGNPPSHSSTSWEYKGSQDGQIHGPYSAQEMLSWTQAGYFIGASAVQIRSVTEKAKSKVDDMLSDLMDDDDDKNGEDDEMVRGKWTSSNDVDFASYS